MKFNFMEFEVNNELLHKKMTTLLKLELQKDIIVRDFINWHKNK